MQAPAAAPLVCHGHSRPINHLEYSNVTEDGVFLISSSKGARHARSRVSRARRAPFPRAPPPLARGSRVRPSRRGKEKQLATDAHRPVVPLSPTRRRPTDDPQRRDGRLDRHVRRPQGMRLERHPEHARHARRHRLGRLQRASVERHHRRRALQLSAQAHRQVRVLLEGLPEAAHRRLREVAPYLRPRQHRRRPLRHGGLPLADPHRAVHRRRHPHHELVRRGQGHPSVGRAHQHGGDHA